MDLKETNVVDRTVAAYSETAEFYRRGFAEMVAVQERNLKLSQEWNDRVRAEVERQFAANVAMSEELVDRVLEQRRVYQSFVEGSVDTWLDFWFAPIGRVRENLKLVVEVGEEMAEATQDSLDTFAEIATDSVFPVEGYDEMNVEQVRAASEGLSAAQIRTLRDYEKSHKGRETVMDFFDRKLKAKSA